MKKYILGLILILLNAGILNAQRVKGSETVLPITQKAAENFIRLHPKSNITVTGGGSGVGIASLLNG
ncbi:MAG: phosphate ABC transporter substrate-binding protein, partial [Weeksellaceae bacterium]|nr:phosphate ABC transporter substrate-binding protein [Weeksellaceae bacterium]